MTSLQLCSIEYVTTGIGHRSCYLLFVIFVIFLRRKWSYLVEISTRVYRLLFEPPCTHTDRYENNLLGGDKNVNGATENAGVEKAARWKTQGVVRWKTREWNATFSTPHYGAMFYTPGFSTVAFSAPPCDCERYKWQTIEIHKMLKIFNCKPTVRQNSE